MTTADVTKQASEKVQAFFSGASEKAQAAFGKSSKIGEEFTSIAKDNAEAFVESGKLAAKGIETLAQDAAEYGKRSFEHATTAFKTLSSAKTPAELFQLQGEFARASFDSAIAEASKFSETWLKVTGEIFQPISNRYAVTVEKIRSTTSI